MIIRRHACKLDIRSQRETYITDRKHASLGICVRGNTHPWETHITVTPALFVGFSKTGSAGSDSNCKRLLVYCVSVVDASLKMFNSESS